MSDIWRIYPGLASSFLSSPTVAVMQWRNEIEAHSEDMKVLVWHGSSRETDAKALKKYDVVYNSKWLSV